MALTRGEVKSMIRQPRVLHKFYIYDPGVADTLGGLTVLDEKDDKGNVKENTRHVLAVQQQVQYWIDQGLMGDKPFGEIGDKNKKLVAQITRGRSENPDEEPRRVARYDKSMQSGHPVFAGQPASAARFREKQAMLRSRSHKGKKQEPFTSTNPDNPQAQAKPPGSPASPRQPATPPTTPRK